MLLVSAMGHKRLVALRGIWMPYAAGDLRMSPVVGGHRLNFDHLRAAFCFATTAIISDDAFTAFLYPHVVMMVFERVPCFHTLPITSRGNDRLRENNLKPIRSLCHSAAPCHDWTVFLQPRLLPSSLTPSPRDRPRVS